MDILEDKYGVPEDEVDPDLMTESENAYEYDEAEMDHKLDKLLPTL